jgi:transcriptional regulator with XRE-family HTH domain
MSEPNTSLRAVRLSMRMSQDEMARAIRQAGQRAGEPNTCTKRLIQRWEAGLVTMPHGTYARALEYVTGQPVENLGFKPAEETYGLDRGQVMDTGGGAWIPLDDPKAKGPLTGIWLSHYEYPSTSRGQVFSNEHYVVIIQHGARLQVRSVPGSASRVMMDLTVNGQVITGTWTEETSPGGYYQGAVYSGGIQHLLDPTGRRMTGKWVGYGKDFEVNTGPWTLQLVSADTGKAALEKYDRVPEPSASA